MQLFKDTNGKLSSKRIFGALGFLAAMVAICLEVDSESIRFLLITSAALLGLGVAENMFKQKQ